MKDRFSKITQFACLNLCISLCTSFSTPTRAEAQTQTTVKKIVAAASVTGHYLEKDSGDTLDVQLLPGGKIKIDLNAYYPCANPSLADRPGGPNMGETDATIAIKNNHALYSTDENSGHCKITFDFAPKSVTINQDEQSMGCCGYGYNVNASGTYRKISNKPKF